LSTGYDTRLVRARRHALFYWLIPENERRGALGIIGEGSGQETKRRSNSSSRKRNDGLGMAGREIPVYRKWVPVRRRIGNGEVFWWATRLHK